MELSHDQPRADKKHSCAARTRRKKRALLRLWLDRAPDLAVSRNTARDVIIQDLKVT